MTTECTVFAQAPDDCSNDYPRLGVESSPSVEPCTFNAVGVGATRAVITRRGYDPARRAGIAAGQTLVAIHHDEHAAAVDQVRVSSGDRLRLLVDRRALGNGVARLRVSEREPDGYWLRLRRGVRLY